MTASGPLFERGAELAALDGALAAAASGAGRVLLYEGEAGIGKTSLLERAAASARERGLAVISARGGELEAKFGYGVVRQLFERPLREADSRARRRLLAGTAALAGPLLGMPDGGSPLASADPHLTTVHSLYWLTVNLAEQQPLVVLVDDVQWADAESLDWLVYLARRLEGVGCSLILTARSGEPVTDGERLAALRVEASVRAMALEPLTSGATALLAERWLKTQPAAEFAAACRDVTGGNPFLLGELLRDLADRGVRPDSAAVAEVQVLLPAAVSRSVLVRLRRLGGGARALALAVAVLDADAEVGRAAELAGLDAARGAEAADALVAAGILVDAVPLRFAHPLLRTAVYADAGALERGRLHRAAAALLDRDGQRERAALQLLAAPPEGDPRAVDWLEAASGAALARGAPEAAVRLLRRALAEPPRADRRAAILTQLGTAELFASDPAAVEHLERAHAEAADPVESGRLALLLGRALLMSGRPAAAVEIMDAAIADLPAGERELAMALETALIGASIIMPDLHRGALERLTRWQGRLSGETPGERALLAEMAMAAAMGHGTAGEAAGLARRALAGDLLLREQTSDSQIFIIAASALAESGALGEADAAYTAALADATARGSVLGFAVTSAFRAYYAFRRGDVAAAEADARAAIRFEASPSLVPVRGYLVEALVGPLLARGDVDAAHDAVARMPPGFEQQPLHHVARALLARGRVRLARRDAAGAMADFLECGRRQHEFGVTNPAQFPWTGPAAEAASILGHRERALDLARQPLEAARRFGAPAGLAACLRALGRLEEGETGIGLLEEAVEVAAASPARLEHAAAMVDLGAALRRANRRSRARELLAEAVDLADACGATVLRGQAEQELQATGARPRRTARHGAQALTASERRVAEMAADGLTNKEIAQALFVTAKTVETHLAAAFRKLGVATRRDLGAHLGP